MNNNKQSYRVEDLILHSKPAGYVNFNLNSTDLLLESNSNIDRIEFYINPNYNDALKRNIESSSELILCKVSFQSNTNNIISLSLCIIDKTNPAVNDIITIDNIFSSDEVNYLTQHAIKLRNAYLH